MLDAQNQKEFEYSIILKNMASKDCKVENLDRLLLFTTTIKVLMWKKTYK